MTASPRRRRRRISLRRRGLRRRSSRPRHPHQLGICHQRPCPCRAHQHASAGEVRASLACYVPSVSPSQPDRRPSHLVASRARSFVRARRLVKNTFSHRVGTFTEATHPSGLLPKIVPLPVPRVPSATSLACARPCHTRRAGRAQESCAVESDRARHGQHILLPLQHVASSGGAALSMPRGS